jgi:hypothetical protein
MMTPDNLDDAQRLIERQSNQYSAASIEMAKALALIDIGHTLRDIRETMREWETYGLSVKNKVG